MKHLKNRISIGGRFFEMLCVVPLVVADAIVDKTISNPP